MSIAAVASSRYRFAACCLAVRIASHSWLRQKWGMEQCRYFRVELVDGRHCFNLVEPDHSSTGMTNIKYLAKSASSKSSWSMKAWYQHEWSFCSALTTSYSAPYPDVTPSPLTSSNISWTWQWRSNGNTMHNFYWPQCLTLPAKYSSPSSFKMSAPLLSLQARCKALLEKQRHLHICYWAEKAK